VTERPDQGLSLRSVGRSALILTGSTAAIQVLAIVRELFVAAKVGISTELDAMLIALVLPITLSGVLTTGTVTALVPAYLTARETRGPDAARRLAGLVLVWVGLGGLGLSIALELLAGVAVSITGPGLSAAGHDSAVLYLRFLAPLAFIAGISGILYGVSQAEEQFRGIALSMIAGAATLFASVVLLWDALGLGALAVGNLLGPVVTCGVLLVTSMRANVIPKPTIRPSGPELGAFLRHAVPLTISGAVLQINVIGDRAIASLLAPGAVSALRYGDVLVRTPISAIGPAWGSALYPALVRTAHAPVEFGLGAATARAIRFVLAVFVPLAVFTAAVAPIAVSVAFERGAFGPLDVERTARVVAAFAPMIVILMVSPVLVGALNARQRGRALLAGGMLNVALNIALDVALGAWLGVAGIALASSVTSTIVLIFFARRVATSERSFELAPLVRTGVTALLASLPTAFVAAAIAWGGFVPRGVVPGLAFLVVVGTLGLIVYVAVAASIGLAEARVLLQFGRDRVRRRFEPPRPTT
jgi:putative peptidoglycan lipid II flippase